ncbi:MAG: hypothetical protein LBM67_08220 [Lentimicrobiaceae bacterium]|jgi:hypothetical protein|nr:hypothetical protein [Lentimicrobiaceae bacterium]
MQNISKIIPFVIISIIILASSCQKRDEISTDSKYKLSFSADSVLFDTVFTSLGSARRQLMIYNKNSKPLKIASIRLANGSSSPFRINVDGIAGEDIYDVEIQAKDSLYVNVRVTIDPQNQNLPYIVEDDIVFQTNTNEQKVKLVAWGQDAIYIVADSYTPGFPKYKIVADSLQTTIWTAERPYVVYGFAVIDSYGTLQIEQGTQVHFHDGSGLWSYSEGQLIVNGTFENPVVFRGDRLEQAYSDLPGQWDRIWLMEARAGADHIIEHAIIRNGFIGIQAESFLKPTAAALRINNTIIENHTGMGIYTSLYTVEAKNFVVANCGNYAIALTGGGYYRFIHGTVANNWNLSVRNTPSLFFNNVLYDENQNPIAVPFNFEMGNSIVYGSLQEEFESDFVAGNDTTYLFVNTILRSKQNKPTHESFVNCLNEDPLFLDYQLFNYRLDSLSPAIGKGILDLANEVPFDLDNNSRLPLPDLGAYQYVEQVEKRKLW